jgi:Relaxase/Mobilisation nuclease domain
MISKIFKYSDFSAVLKYVLEDVEATLVSTNMTARNYGILAKEFQLFASLNPQQRCICNHMIISISCRSADHILGECNQHLNDYEYYRIARRYLEEMGFLGGSGMHKCQYIAVRHDNRDRREIHIIVSRIRMDGTLVSDTLETRRNDVVMRQLTHEFDIENFEGTELLAS